MTLPAHFSEKHPKGMRCLLPALLLMLVAQSCKPGLPEGAKKIIYGGSHHVLHPAQVLSKQEHQQLMSLSQRHPQQPITLRPWRLDGKILVASSGRIHVRFRQDASPGQLRAVRELIRPYQVSTLAHVSEQWTVLERMFDALDQLTGQDAVEWAEPELALPVKLGWAPNDPLFSRQWHLANTGQYGAKAGVDVGAQQAWDITRGSPDVVIAIIDEGIDLDHEDLDPCRIAPGTDLMDGDNNPRPGFFEDHGTACAGVAAASANNHVGGSGICPQCRIMPIRLVGQIGSVADELGSVSWLFDSVLANAFTFAVDHGADILSNSWYVQEGTPLPTTLVAAIAYANTQGRGGLGAPVVFCAGNDNTGTGDNTFLSLPGVLGVAATTDQDLRAPYSNFGPGIDISAPSGGGVRDIWTTDVMGPRGTNFGDPSVGDRRGNFGLFSGTSASTPLVAGTLGLMLSVNPQLTRDQVVQLLQETAIKVGGDSAGYNAQGFSHLYGYGRIHAGQAVAAALQARTQGALGSPCTSGCGDLVCTPGGHFDDYCTQPCTTPADCPEGYVCQAAPNQPASPLCLRTSTCPAGVELCGDGVDNNGNNQADEGCPTPCTQETIDGRCDGNSWVACEAGQVLGGTCPPGTTCGVVTEGLVGCTGCGEIEVACQGGVIYGCWSVTQTVIRMSCPEACGFNQEGKMVCLCASGLVDSACSQDGNLDVCNSGIQYQIPCENGCEVTEDGFSRCKCAAQTTDLPTCVGNDLVICSWFNGSTLRMPCSNGCQPGAIDGYDGCLCQHTMGEWLACVDGNVVMCGFLTGEESVSECPNGCLDPGDGGYPSCLCQNGQTDFSSCDGNDLLFCGGGTGETIRMRCPYGCKQVGTNARCSCEPSLVERPDCREGSLARCSFPQGDTNLTPCAYGCGMNGDGFDLCGCPDVPVTGFCSGNTLHYCGYRGEHAQNDCAETCVVDEFGFARCTDPCALNAETVAYWCNQGYAMPCPQNPFSGWPRIPCSELGATCEMNDGGGSRCVRANLDGGTVDAGDNTVDAAVVVSSSGGSSSSSGGEIISSSRQSSSSSSVVSSSSWMVLPSSSQEASSSSSKSSSVLVTSGPASQGQSSSALASSAVSNGPTVESNDDDNNDDRKWPICSCHATRDGSEGALWAWLLLAVGMTARSARRR